MKQIGISIHNFHDTQNGLTPIAIGNGPVSFWGLLYPFNEQIALYEFLLARGIQNGINADWWKGAAGSGGTSGVLMTDELRNSFGAVAYMKCPSRRSGVALVSADLTVRGGVRAGPQGDYAAVCLGQAFAISRQTDTTRPDANWINIHSDSLAQMMRCPFRHAIGGADRWRPRDTFARISDGTSNQFFIGEKHIPVEKLTICSPSTDSGDYTNSHDCSYLGGTAGGGTTPGIARTVCHWHWDYIATPEESPLALGPTYRETGESHRAGFGSYHPGICNFLMGDGVVRPLNVVTPVQPVLVPLSDVEDGKTVTMD